LFYFHLFGKGKLTILTIAMDDCIFCKIATGQAPAKVVFEDNEFMGIMDIAPISEGQVLIIPKKHYRWVWDVENFGEYWEAARKVAQAQMKGLGAKFVEFLTHGMDVHHAHIWVVPIYNEEVFINMKERKKFTEDEMNQQSEKIKSGFK
jgi:histidine triad (HIT) family protein